MRAQLVWPQPIPPLHAPRHARDGRRLAAAAKSGRVCDAFPRIAWPPCPNSLPSPPIMPAMSSRSPARGRARGAWLCRARSRHRQPRVGRLSRHTPRLWRAPSPRARRTAACSSAAPASACRSPPTAIARFAPRCATTARRARLARQHNDANVLVLGGRLIGPETRQGLPQDLLLDPRSRAGATPGASPNCPDSARFAHMSAVPNPRRIPPTASSPQRSPTPIPRSPPRSAMS